MDEELGENWVAVPSGSADLHLSLSQQTSSVVQKKIVAIIILKAVTFYVTGSNCDSMAHSRLYIVETSVCS